MRAISGKPGVFVVVALAFLAPTSRGLHAGGRSAHSGRRDRAPASPTASVSVSEREVVESAAAAARVNVRSIRPEGLKGAGLRYAEASLASTTGPVFNADDVLQDGEALTPAQAIKGLYAAFNARDTVCVASFLTDECVYEDLLLGPATVCRGKQAFMNALQFHPAFVSSRVLSGLPFADLLPALTLEVDSIAEGHDTVGVEWHVQCGDTPFPLGRGLSQAQVCPLTGKIKRVVDIAEAPWRVIGLLALPLINGFQLVARAVRGDGIGSAAASSDTSGGDTSSSSGGSGRSGGGASTGTGAAGKGSPGAGARPSPANIERQYELMLSACLADGIVHPNERAMLTDFAVENSVSERTHRELLAQEGWSESDYIEGYRRG